MAVTDKYAAILREAARRMTERAKAANAEEARRPYGDQALQPVPAAEWGKLVDNYLGGVMGTHCASWHPVAAIAVADWLEDEAVQIDDTPYRVDDDWVERNYRAPLAAARAYLGPNTVTVQP
ncbi:hypothetical protein [Micromonospora sp. IBHARD004]|uniref:hypothetical protein n=1 Tax=Micromonospora sp. IBHARD004 TaxID=3457764 RepID=UPI00405817EA